jgi:hypothetical protein
MSCENLQNLLNRGKEQYRSLLAETTNLLRKCDAFGPEGCEWVIARRQECISELHEIDNRLIANLKGMGRDLSADARQALDEFRTLQEMTTRKILEFDSLVIALAGDRLNTIKSELAALARGKAALSGYERTGRAFRRNINDTA